MKDLFGVKFITVPAERFDAEVQRWIHKGMTIDRTASNLTTDGITPRAAMLVRGRPADPPFSGLPSRSFGLFVLLALPIWMKVRPKAVQILVKEDQESRLQANRALLAEDIAVLAERVGWTLDGPIATFQPSPAGWSARVQRIHPDGDPTRRGFSRSSIQPGSRRTVAERAACSALCAVAR